MKNLLFLLFILLQFSTFAQNGLYKTWNDSEQIEYISDIEEIKKGEYTILRSIATEVHQSKHSEIIVIDDKGNTLKTLTISSPSTPYSDVLNEIIPLKGSLLLFGTREYPNEDSTTLLFYRTDYEFNVLQEKTLKIFKTKIIGAMKGYLHPKTGQVYFNMEAYRKSDPDLIAGVMDTLCQNVELHFPFSKLNLLHLTDISHDLDSTGFIGTGMFRIYQLNSGLENPKEYNIDGLGISNTSTRVFDKSRYISIALDEQLPTPPYQTTQASVCFFDKNFKIKKKTLIGKPYGNQVDTVDNVAFKGLDWVNKGNIFVGGHTFKGDTDLPFLDTRTWLRISALDGNLNPKWTRYIDSKRFNYTFGIKATEDNGVILYGIQYEENSTNPMCFILKIDENGLFLADKNISKLVDIDIFPNPVNDILTIKLPDSFKFAEGKVILSNSLGQQMNTARLQDGTNHINISRLPSGLYYYNIIADNFMIGNGILIKK